MGAVTTSSHIKLTLVAILAGCILVWLWNRRERPVEPAEPNPFVAEFIFERIDDGSPIGDTVTIEVDHGCYAHVSLTAAPALPPMLEGRDVVEPAEWTVVLVVYPRGSSPDAEDAVCLPCARYASESHRGRRNIVGVGIPIGNPSAWFHSEYDGAPVAPVNLDPAALNAWTYFAVDTDQPGEYIYELTLYPTAAPRSAIRFETGEPVVVKRGLLRVVDAGMSHS